MLFIPREELDIVERSRLRSWITKSGVSRLAPSNNSHEIIAVICTANFMTVIAEELTHGARSLEKRSRLVQIVSDIEALNEECFLFLVKSLISSNDLGCAAGQEKRNEPVRP